MTEVPEREKVHFLFSLGKAFEDMGNYDESFEYYKRGNDLNRGRTTYDPKAIEALIQKVLNSNEDKVKQYKSGKDKLFGFFVGQVMKETQGKANPKSVNEILKKLLK